MADKKFSITLFLIAIFVFLGVYIAMWIYGIYVEKASFASKTSSETIKCASYDFELTNIEYSKKALSFDIQNMMGDKFEELVISSGAAERTLEIKQFFKDSFEQVLVNDIEVSESFIAYPKGCKDGNAKEYRI